MGSVDYKDLKEPYDKTAQTTRMLAINAAHLAKLLEGEPNPEWTRLEIERVTQPYRGSPLSKT